MDENDTGPAEVFAHSEIAGELAALCDAPPVSIAEIPNAVFFKLPTERIRQLVAERHEEFLRKGVYLFESRRHLGLMRTTDKYEVMRAMGTNGTNYDLMTEDIIARLKEIEHEHPFVITGVGADFVSGRFLPPIQNSRRLARQLYELCPDMVDQGAGTLANAALLLRKTHQLFLWWD